MPASSIAAPNTLLDFFFKEDGRNQQTHLQTHILRDNWRYQEQQKKFSVFFEHMLTRSNIIISLWTHYAAPSIYKRAAPERI